ncbi:LysR substrate-binding domain-containing protein [Citrobacter sp. JGM124]|uniref:LysR substrate-binding domain-containing protein n=1 Tax=Citrobacter sp. JGM124 TaxID=2799789 RepID=UPI001BA9737E|nr:LysR substrate-binding domain-containing protein [Citrobacter sp. JGM124]MBS0847332.1 LysR family transcriptional regulator [Citrobacter sp. JGM124]
MLLSRRALPSLNGLRAFEASGRKLSFRAAAEELGVTQGAVAQQIRALEDHLGLKLFYRLPKGLSLTQQGTAYLADVTRAFDTLVESTSRLQARPDVVTISVTPTVAAKLIIPLLGEFQAAFPGIELRTVATETLADFDRDQVDIAVRLSRAPLPSTMEGELLFRQHLIAVACPRLLENIALPLAASQISTFPLLHDTNNCWPDFLQTAGKPPGALFNQTTLALDAAMAGQGVALACEVFVAADVKAGRLVMVADAGNVEGDYYLVRKRASVNSKAAQAVWEWCLKHLRHISRE